MKKYIRFITLLFVILFCLFPCEAEEPTIYQVEKQMNDVLEEMDLVLQKLSKKYDEFTPGEPLGKALWSALEKSKYNINLILSYSSKISYSPLFLSTLEYDIEVFRRFVQFTSTGRIPLPSSTEVSDVLNASRDLELKSRLIKKSETDLVEVKVNTINRQEEDINNCMVWYVPFVKDDDKHKLRFYQPSTPTTGSIPGGKWLIWAEKDERLGPKDPFEFGYDGNSKCEIYIFSPE